MDDNYKEIMTLYEGPQGNLKMQIDQNADPAKLFYQILSGCKQLREAMMDAITAYAATETDFVELYNKLCTITSHISNALKDKSNPNYQYPIFNIVSNGKESN